MFLLRTILLPLIIVSLFFFSNAQSFSTDFEVITEDMFELNSFEKQENCKAIVITNFGQYYGIQENDGEKMVREYHYKVKILSEAGVKKYANLKIDYYPAYKHNIAYLSAASYNIENGQIEKQKVGIKDAYTEQVNDIVSRKVLAIPNVKIGSIVEFTYTIIAPLSYTYPPFYLQMEDPVLQAEFRFQNPKYTSFTCIRSGLNASEITISENSTIRNSIEINRNSPVLSFKIQNLIGLENEPFVNYKYDYFTKIQFQLYQFDNGQFVESFAQNWDDIVSDFEKDINTQFKAVGHKFIHKELSSIFSKATNDIEKIKIAFDYVRNNYTWNGNTRIDINDQKLKETYHNKYGSSSQLNLLLAYLLINEDILLHPVLVSTHEHGKIMLEYPYKFQFNNIVWLYEGNEPLVLDVRNSQRPFDVIPKDILSTTAVLMKNGEAKQLTINSSFKWSEVNVIQIQNFNEKKISGTVKMELKGYAALNARNEFTESEFLNNSLEETNSLNPTNEIINNFNDINKNIAFTFDFSTSEYLIQDNEELLINPTLSFGLDENPFSLPSRNLPIVFNYLYNFDNRIVIQIPAGYELVSLPKEVNVKSDDGLINFFFKSSQNNNLIQLMGSLKILKPEFEAIEYEMVKNIFDQAIKNQNNYIVFKKL